jgi:hypothetical protein
MKKFVLLTAFLFAAAPALAQGPGGGVGPTPPADPWIISGNTVYPNGLKVVTTAPNTGSAGFNLPPGTPPTSPVNGDLWTTSSGLYVQTNGTTTGPLVGGPGSVTAGCLAPWISVAVLGNYCGISVNGTTITVGNLTSTLAPTISGGYLGATLDSAWLGNWMAAQASTPEVGAMFSMQSSVGMNANPALYFKAALGWQTILSSGSASGWGAVGACTLNSGAGSGSQLGCNTLELDLNVNNAAYTGVGVPNAFNLFLSGSVNSSSHYGQGAICICYAAANPLWNYGIVFWDNGMQGTKIAAIYDDDHAPSFIFDQGAHTNGIQLSGTYSGYQIVGDSFYVDPSGDIFGAWFSTTGANAGYQFNSRSTGHNWLLYDNAGVATLFDATAGAGLITFQPANGNFWTAGNIVSSSTVSVPTSPNCANAYLIGSNPVICDNGSFTVMYAEGGSLQGMLLSSGIDYFNSASFTFRNAAGTSTFATITSAGVTIAGLTTAANSTATAAGGTCAYAMGSSGIEICWGSGAPTISAPQGSIYLRTDGNSTSTRLYVNTNGSTGWTDFTSAS